jgi:hypothetical protein
LCAGGFGAMDIGLQHPGLFAALESWQGYFAPVFDDGPFLGAPPGYLNANNPTMLVQNETSQLRSEGLRFYVSVGGDHGDVLGSYTLGFAALLHRLGRPCTLWELPAAEQGHCWTATVPSALEFASASFAPAPPEAGLLASQHHTR